MGVQLSAPLEIMTEGADLSFGNMEWKQPRVLNIKEVKRLAGTFDRYDRAQRIGSAEKRQH